MEIKIDTNIAGVELHQMFRIIGLPINKLDEKLIQKMIILELKKAERDLMSTIIRNGAKTFN